MEIILFALLFVVGYITYLLSLKIHEKDITNAYQVQLSFLSIVLFTILAYSSFNIEIYSTDSTLTSKSFIDYGYLAASVGMFLMSLINLIILLIWGSYNVLFSRR